MHTCAQIPVYDVLYLLYTWTWKCFTSVISSCHKNLLFLIKKPKKVSVYYFDNKIIDRTQSPLRPCGKSFSLLWAETPVAWKALPSFFNSRIAQYMEPLGLVLNTSKQEKEGALFFIWEVYLLETTVSMEAAPSFEVRWFLRKSWSRFNHWFLSPPL